MVHARKKRVGLPPERGAEERGEPMKPPRDYLDCDPGWHYCPGCDRDGDFKPSANGLCPECEAKRNAEASEEAHHA